MPHSVHDLGHIERATLAQIWRKASWLGSLFSVLGSWLSTLALSSGPSRRYPGLATSVVPRQWSSGEMAGLVWILFTFCCTSKPQLKNWLHLDAVRKVFSFSSSFWLYNNKLFYMFSIFVFLNNEQQ